MRGRQPPCVERTRPIRFTLFVRQPRHRAMIIRHLTERDLPPVRFELEHGVTGVGRPGLDHVSFGCANRAELVTWEQRLAELGIAHGGIVDAGYGSGLSFRDPDNIALEFFAPPA